MHSQSNQPPPPKPVRQRRTQSSSDLTQPGPEVCMFNHNYQLHHHYIRLKLHISIVPIAAMLI